MMFDVLLTLLSIVGTFFTVVGVLVFVHVLRPQRPPSDTSNRINKVRLLWFALTREELFIPVFPWLGGDELDNVRREA